MPKTRYYKLSILVLLFVLLLPSNVLAQSGAQVIIHSTHAEPVQGKVAYTVQVFLSVLDTNGTPLKDLKSDNFSLTEDSQEMQIDSVEPVANEDTSLVLVLDTSGSMLGQGIIDARNAAAGFLERLGSNDQAAVITFNDTASTITSFSNNHSSSSEAVKQINAVNRAGTCLYDAAYQAVEMASTTPPGRRAVVVFTDGKDETISGEKCSFHTIDDVIDLAKTTGSPVYTLGMGSTIDEKELKRLASTTGGSYLASRDSSELDTIFTRLYDQLNNEYVLTYTSTSAPGPHSMTVEVNFRNQESRSTYTFNLPALPTAITFNSPADGETLTGKTTLKAKILTQGAEVASVEFAANGVIIGKDISEPYEYEWDLTNEAPAETLLEAVAMGKDGAELARAALTVFIGEASAAAGTLEGGSDEDGGETPAAETDLNQPLASSSLLIYLGIGGLLLVGGFVAFILLKRRKKAPEPDKEDDFALKHPDKTEDATFDGIDLRGIMGSTPGGSVLATLTILASDDPASIGNQYSITHLPVIMGRSAEDADILFSGKDQAVSRRHATMEAKGSEITLRDLGSKYGTFHNDQPIGGVPVTLKNGDEIRLGSRAKLRFEQAASLSGSSDETYDGLNMSGLTDEATRDSI